jgi:hypothetical protein
MVSYINQLIIKKENFELIENQNLEIKFLNISDISNPKDIFYLKKINYFINTKNIEICFQIITYFSKKEIEEENNGSLEKLTNMILNHSNLSNIPRLLGMIFSRGFIYLLNESQLNKAIELILNDKNLKYYNDLLRINFDSTKGPFLNEDKVEEIVDLIINSKNENVMINLIYTNINKNRFVKDFKLQDIKNKIINDKNLKYLIDLLFINKNYDYKLFKMHELLKIKELFLKSNDSNLCSKYLFLEPNIKGLSLNEDDKKKFEEICLEDLSENVTNFDSILNYCGNNRWYEFEKKALYKFQRHDIIIYIKKYITERDEIIEDAIFKANINVLYFYYCKIVLKKPWEDFRGIIKNEIIRAAISSIKINYRVAIKYTEITKKRFDSYLEKQILDIDVNKLLNDELLEMFLLDIYIYVKLTVKERFPEFEKMLIKTVNTFEGLDFDVSLNDHHHLVALYNVIYDYISNFLNGTWKEIGIKNNSDFEKLKKYVTGNYSYEFTKEYFSSFRNIIIVAYSDLLDDD